MAFYRICPDCGAYLDPGEQCSCHEERLIEMERKEKENFSKCQKSKHIHFLNVLLKYLELRIGYIWLKQQRMILKQKWKRAR